jgi:hypothetical protein
VDVREIITPGIAKVNRGGEVFTAEDAEPEKCYV